MKSHIRLTLAAVAAALALGAGASAQKGDSADALLRIATDKASVDGDLQAAISQYQAIVDKYAKTDRRAAATALLRMAECYQKIGDKQARTIYERIVREYADQKEAITVATARLGASPGANAKVLHPIWTERGAGSAGNVSADGRFMPFTDSRGDLMVRNLVNGTDSRLTDVGSDNAFREFAEDNAVMSRDGRKVAYVWWLDSGNFNELRVIERASSGTSSPRVLVDRNKFPDVSYVAPLDWAPDGEWIVVQVQRRDGAAQIGILTLADGAFRQLKSIDWRGVTKLAVSPAGTLLAYDLPTDEQSSHRDIFVMSRDGQRPEYKVNGVQGRNVVVGWTPDGGSLLFAHEQSGTMGLWQVPIVDGVPRGAAKIVEPDLGTFVGSLGITTSGRLMFMKKVGGVNIYTSAVDLTTGAVLSPAAPVTDSLLSNNRFPVWGPDGKSLAYLSGSPSRGGTTVVFRSLQTAESREVTPQMSNIGFLNWSARDFITAQGADLKGRQGIYRLDVRTGQTSPIVLGSGDEYLSWSVATPDGRRLLYTRNQAGKYSMMVRDVSSGEERVLLSNTLNTAKAISADGQLVAYRTGDSTSSSIRIVPITGGTPRELLKIDGRPQLAHFVAWTPDGRFVLAARTSAGTEGKGVTLVIPASGGTPTQVDTASGALHPDGRRMAFSSGASSFEVWALENFLPAAKK